MQNELRECCFLPKQGLLPCDSLFIWSQLLWVSSSISLKLSASCTGSRQSKRVWGNRHSSEEQGQSWVSYVRLKRMGRITLAVEAPVVKNPCCLPPVLWPDSLVTQTGACSSCRRLTPAPALRGPLCQEIRPLSLPHNQTLPDHVRGPFSLLLKVGSEHPPPSVSSPWFPVLSTPGKPCDHRDKPVPKGFSLSPFICLINLIKVGLIYSTVLISTIHQSDSVQCDSVICLHTHTHTHILG